MSKEKISKEVVESLKEQFGCYFDYVKDLDEKLEEFNLKLITDDEDKLFIYKGSLIEAFMENRCRPYDGFIRFSHRFVDIMECLNSNVNYSKSDFKKLFEYFKYKFDFERIREEGIKNNIFKYFFKCHPYYIDNVKVFSEFMTSLGYKLNDEVEFLDFIKRYDEVKNKGRKVYIDCCSYWVEIYNKETAENPNYTTKIKLEKA